MVALYHSDNLLLPDRMVDVSRDIAALTSGYYCPGAAEAAGGCIFPRVALRPSREQRTDSFVSILQAPLNSQQTPIRVQQLSSSAGDDGRYPQIPDSRPAAASEPPTKPTQLNPSGRPEVLLTALESRSRMQAPPSLDPTR